MGGGNPMKVLKEVALNVGTGGLYGIGKGIKTAIDTGKVGKGAGDALANWGVGGNVLTPAVGTKTSLGIQSAVAGGAFATAGAASALGVGAGAAGAGAGGAGSTGLTAAELAAAGTTAATPGTTAALAAGAGAGTAAAGGVGSYLTGQNALVAASLASAGASAFSANKNKPPKLPNAVDPATIDQKAIDAANAVQSSAAEARRMRASKRQSSVLSNFQGASQVGVSPATLQPAQPRRSVLG